MIMWFTPPRRRSCVQSFEQADSQQYAPEAIQVHLEYETAAVSGSYGGGETGDQARCNEDKCNAGDETTSLM